MSQELIPFPFTQQTFCRYEPVAQRIQTARILVIDSLLRDEGDLSDVARNEWGQTLAAQMRRERLIAGMAIENILNNISRLVLKPNDDYGGHGITIGWNVDPAGWEKAIQSALANGDYLVQERVPTARETFPALTSEGRIEFAEQLVDLDPLLFNGKVGSAFTRLSATELANVSSGGGMVPTYIISQK